MTDAIEAGAMAIDAMLDEKTWTNDVPPTYSELAKACIEAAIASGALVPASAVAEMPDGAIDRVAEAIAARAIERGHPIKPVVVRHVAVAAIDAMRQLDIAPASAVAEMRERCAKRCEEIGDEIMERAEEAHEEEEFDAYESLECAATEYSRAASAIRQLDLAPASGDYVVVPREPSEASLNAARDWSREKYGMPIGNDAAIECYRAMLNAASRTGGGK